MAPANKGHNTPLDTRNIVRAVRHEVVARSQVFIAKRPPAAGSTRRGGGGLSIEFGEGDIARELRVLSAQLCGELSAKPMGYELVPNATLVLFLLKPNNPDARLIYAM